MVVYGKNHPYGEFSTEQTLENVTLDGIKDYYNTWFKPNIAYMIIVGDITRAEVEPLLKTYFGGWKPGDNMNADKVDYARCFTR